MVTPNVEMVAAAADATEAPNSTVARHLAWIAGLLCCLIIHTTANAIPIGDFNWSEHSSDECDAGLCGAVFFVDNFSNDPDISLGSAGDSFFNVTVNLQTANGPLSLSLGDIATGSSSQSIDDLSGQDIASAALTLTFGSPALPGTLQLLDADGNVQTGLTADGSLLIDYLSGSGTGGGGSGGGTSVPEPPPALLLAIGVIGLAFFRKNRTPRRAAGRVDMRRVNRRGITD